MRKALSDPALLANVLVGKSWAAWRVLLIAMMGEPLDADERKLFRQLTGGRRYEPGERVEEFTAVIGRRGGKSRAMSTLAAYIAGLCEHEALVHGETGVLLCIAPDVRQANIILDFAEAAFQSSDVMQGLVAQRTVDALELVNGIRIEVRSASFRRLRGPTYIAVIADESAFFFSDEFSSNADVEIINAVRPGLSTTHGPLIIASSPYAQRGVLFENYKRNYGPEGDPLLLVAKGTSRELNSSLSQRVVDRAMERDEASARAEYLAEFRSDVQSFVDPEVIAACTIKGRHELPVASGIRYVAFTDPSGGKSDSMTLAIGHLNKERILVVDCVREVKAPFKPAQVVAEFATLLKVYHCTKVVGDRYGGEWPVERFRDAGITYEIAEKPKGQLYLDALAMLNSNRVELLDNPRIASQFITLERYSGRSQRDSVDHPPGGRDDVANAVAGLICLLSQKSAPMSLEYMKSVIAQSQARARDPYGGVGEKSTGNVSVGCLVDIEEDYTHEQQVDDQCGLCPSPSGHNDEQLFLKTTLVRRSQLAQDASPFGASLGKALRRKFGTPEAVCARLGLDVKLLRDDEYDRKDQRR